MWRAPVQPFCFEKVITPDRDSSFGWRSNSWPEVEGVRSGLSFCFSFDASMSVLSFEGRLVSIFHDAESHNVVSSSSPESTESSGKVAISDDKNVVL